MEHIIRGTGAIIGGRQLNIVGSQAIEAITKGYDHFEVKMGIIGALLILISATGFALLPLFALLAYDGGANTTTLLFLRFAIATVLLFFYCIIRKTTWTLSARQILTLFLMGGILYMLQSLFYLSSIKYMPASLAALLLYTYPVLVAILSFAVEKEKITKRVILSIVLTMIGMVLVLGVSGRMNIKGALLAFGAALVYACYIIIGNRTVSKVSPAVTSLLVSFFASISFLIIGLTNHSITLAMTSKAWMAVMGVGICSTVVAILAFFAGLKLIGPTKASLLSTLEPVITTAGSILLFSQSFNWIQALGGGIILTGAVLIVTIQKEHIQCPDTNNALPQ